MRVLITNVVLHSQTGTEMYVRDLAITLLRRGHFPVVFSPRLGPLADQLRAASVPVVDRLDQVAEPPDVIHGHHNTETVMALLHFPNAPAVFVCHDATAWHDMPPRMPRVRKYIAVDLACRERLVSQHGITPDQVTVIQNAVDLDRFPLRAPLPPKPASALLISNYVSPEQAEIVRRACQRQEIDLATVGKHLAGTHQHPEQLMQTADLVFAKARCAWEAMATGAAVIVCDAHGAGSLVTRSNVEELRRWNFGRRLLQRPITEELISHEIQRYDADDARRVTQYIRSIAGTDRQLDQLLTVYHEAIEQLGNPAELDREEELRAAARFLHWLALDRNVFSTGEAQGPWVPRPRKRRWWSRWR